MKKLYKVYYRSTSDDDYHLIDTCLDQENVLETVRNSCTHCHSEGEDFKVYEVIGGKENEIEYRDWF